MARLRWFAIFALTLALGCSLIRAPRPQHIIPNFSPESLESEVPTTQEEVFAALTEGRPEEVLAAPPELLEGVAGARMRGAALAMLGDYDAAEKVLLEARKQSADANVSGQICEDLVWIALAKYNYGQAARWHAEQITLCDIKANPLMHLWSRLAISGDSTMTMPDYPVVLPVTGSPFPRAHVKVNGKKTNFIFDTGAGMTAISASLAKSLNLPVISLPDTAHGLGKITVRYTVIDSIEMGEVVFTNVPAVVINDKDLTFTILGIFKLIDVPGIVGLPLLAQMRVTMDMPARRIILEKSAGKLPGTAPNIVYWHSQLYAPVYLAEMGRLNFFVDSGANRSSLSFDAAKLIPSTAKVDRGSRDLAQGAGGSMRMAGEYLPRWMAIDGMRMEGLGLDLESRTREHEDDLLNRDGTLGMDILQCYRVILDIPARSMNLELPPNKQQGQVER
jgi:hypothetical protein